jgi:hypothetical protein
MNYLAISRLFLSRKYSLIIKRNSFPFYFFLPFRPVAIFSPTDKVCCRPLNSLSQFDLSRLLPNAASGLASPVHQPAVALREAHPSPCCRPPRARPGLARVRRFPVLGVRARHDYLLRALFSLAAPRPCADRRGKAPCAPRRLRWVATSAAAAGVDPADSPQRSTSR